MVQTMVWFGNLTRLSSRVALIAILSFFGWHAAAQKLVQESRAQVSFFAGHVLAMGPQDAVENDFRSPALFSNFSTGNAIAISSVFDINGFLGVGITANSVYWSDWLYPGTEETYKFSKAKITSLGPVVRIMTPHKPNGPFNKFKIFAELYELNSKISASLRFRPFGEAGELLPASSIAYNFGFGTAFGVQYAVSNHLGIISQASYTHLNLDSKLYNDKSIGSLMVSGGLYYRARKTKNLF